jgi:hypothetical protein
MDSHTLMRLNTSNRYLNEGSKIIKNFNDY